MRDTFIKSHDSEKSGQSEDAAEPRKKEFALEDILAMTTGRNLSSRGMDAIYDVTKFITGREDVITSDLLMLEESVCASIFTQHPDLQKAAVPEFEEGLSSQEINKLMGEWVAEQKKIFGASLFLTSSSVPVVLKREERLEFMGKHNPNVFEV